MRRLNRKQQTLKIVKELDAFPKVPESYVETTTTGGTVSIVTFVLIAILVISELRYYMTTRMKYEYDVDGDINSKLHINLDITVAMKCDWIGADVLDLAGDSMFTYRNMLNEEPVHFEMSPQEKSWQKSLQSLQKALSEEHAIQEVLFQTGFSGRDYKPKRLQKNTPHDACRIHGTISTNKVAGNFHITIGKSIPHPKGHAHLALMVDSTQYNFSHRIDHFSYGKKAPGLISPLDGTMKVTENGNRIYQYFLQIVPTKLNTYQAKVDTHQFAVTERERDINHAAGSHGVVGIFFKYELSSVVVSVTEVHEPYLEFLVRLCGIVGGIFATSGIINALVGCLTDVICCRYKLGSYKEPQPPAPVQGHQLVPDMANDIANNSPPPMAAGAPLSPMAGTPPPMAAAPPPMAAAPPPPPMAAAPPLDAHQPPVNLLAQPPSPSLQEQ